MTTIKSTNLLKTGLIGLVAAASVGLLTLPVKADEVNQGTVQTNVQDGFGNTGVNQNTNNAEIKKNDVRVGRPAREASSQKDAIRQNADQANDQVGENNTAVNQNNNNARIRSDRTQIRGY
jgi:gas vesicle protein